MIKVKVWPTMATILLAALLSSCAGDPADMPVLRVNGDQWKYGMGFVGPDYPNTGN